ncbi:G-protein coupled receptor Mth-like [Lycorma delicatula]|uniref:G-protein coupled receptor Mth-like n=1 Tax=Lycorma delicatula TaxID=130591 RepID=UPI003F51875D
MITLLKVQGLMFLITMIILFNMKKAVSEEQPCEEWNSIEIDLKGAKRYTNGTIEVEGILYPKDKTYYVNNTLRGCICEVTSCIRKCCPENYAVDSSESCAKIGNHFEVNKISYYEVQPNGDLYKLNELDDDHFQVVNSKDYILDCSPYALDQKSDIGTYHVLGNGSLLYEPRKNKNHIIINIDKYCLEWFDSVKQIIPVLCSPSTSASTSSLMSQPSISSYFKNVRLQIYPVAVFTSLPFLTATFLLYCYISDLQNLFGKSLLNLLFSMIISYLSLGILLIKGAKLSTTICIFLGILFWSSEWISSNI